MTDPSSTPRIVLAGATGLTGNAVAHQLAQRTDVTLAAVVAPSVATTPSRQLPDGVAAFATLQQALSAHQGAYDVLVDFTHADAARHHLNLAASEHLNVVLGTTGIDGEDLQSLGHEFSSHDRALLYVPNFSIGAVLAMRFAREAAPYFVDAEIVEIHHPGKRDAPSGTARLTAQMIAEARAAATGSDLAADAVEAENAGINASRGERIHGIPVHAVRMSGAVAHQETTFGAIGEVLTIRHDANDRSCYAAGVARAVLGIDNLRGLKIGLEHVL